ncbi:MAG: hypothetical protein Kow0022_00040 [Phycisphaerales bacterium]
MPHAEHLGQGDTQMNADKSRESAGLRVAAEITNRGAGDASDPYKWVAIVFSTVVILTLPILLGIVVLSKPEPPPHPWAEAAARLGVNPDDILLGEATYKNDCALCHGPNAEGLPRLGKPLRNSAFVQEHSDEELLQLLIAGRAPSDPLNTTGSLMPPRAAKGLSDSALKRVIAYLRAIQDPSQPPASVEAWQFFEGGTGGQVAAADGSAGQGGVGHDLYVASCSACHGPGGEGMEGLGKPLNTSAFVASKSDSELLAFIKTGRPIWDPENTTGVDMPPKGGNPSLTDEQLSEIIAYIRSIHK